MKKKALIYGLTAAMLLAAALTACHNQQTDQKGNEPDPAASAVVQTSTTPQPSEQATLEPPAQTPEPTQPPEPAPTDTVEQPQAPEETEPVTSPEPAQTTASGPTPISETKPTAQSTSQPSTGSQGSAGQTQTPPSSGSSQVTDAEIQAQIEAAIRQQQEAIANGEVVGSGEVTQEGIEEIGNRLSGGSSTQQQTPPSQSTGDPSAPPGGYSSNPNSGFQQLTPGQAGSLTDEGDVEYSGWIN